MQNWSVGYILTSFEASIRITLLVSPRGKSARSLGERSLPTLSPNPKK